MAVLLATLRPAGVAGDQSDATFDTVNDDGAVGPVTMLFPWLSVVGWDGVGTVEFVRFFSRASHLHEDQGPADPSAGPAWSIDGGVHYGSVQSVEVLDTTVYEVASGDQPLTPGGLGWTAANIATLVMSVMVTTNSLGSQLFTEIHRHEMWAEVWGALPVELPPARSPDRLEAAALTSGDINASLRSGGLTASVAVSALSPRLQSGTISARRDT